MRKYLMVLGSSILLSGCSLSSVEQIGTNFDEEKIYKATCGTAALALCLGEAEGLCGEGNYVVIDDSGYSLWAQSRKVIFQCVN